MSYTPPPLPGEGRRGAHGLFLFKDRIPQAFPSQAKPITGRIMPAFDFSISPADPAFRTSVAAYRDFGNLHPKTGQARFTRWFVTVDVFHHMGLDHRDSFLANSSLGALLGAENVDEFAMRDAVADVRELAGKKAKYDPTIKKMIETEDKRDNPVIAGRSPRVIIGTQHYELASNKWVNGVMPISYSAIDHVGIQLDEFRNPAENPLDPNWPNYLYGDVTHPQTGLQFVTTQITAGTQRPFTGLSFNPRLKTSVGCTPHPIMPEALAERVLFYDPELYTRLTYQEQVDYMVEKTFTPYELIVEACSNFATIPPLSRRPGNHSTFPGTAHAGSPAPALPGYGGQSPATFSMPGYVFPPAGWIQHPQDPNCYYLGNDVKTADQLRAMYPPPQPPAPAIPTAQQAPPLQAPPVATWTPPAGWTQHPADPNCYYLGNDVKTVDQLRAMYPPVQATAPTSPEMQTTVPAGGKPTGPLTPEERAKFDELSNLMTEAKVQFDDKMIDEYLSLQQRSVL